MSDLEDRIGEIDDAKRLADDIVAELKAGDDGEIDLALALAREVAEALSTAEIVETEKDFDINLKDAWNACEALGPALKYALAKAKKDDEPSRANHIDEARTMCKSLLRELRDVMPED